MQLIQQKDAHKEKPAGAIRLIILEPAVRPRIATLADDLPELVFAHAEIFQRPEQYRPGSRRPRLRRLLHKASRA